jgi:RND family efflux transporter MFP subunit
MMVLSRAKFFLLVLAVAIVIVLAVRYRQELFSWARSQTPVDEHAGHDISAMAPAPEERRILYWYDPMHPAYKSDKPGIAPDCGMKLVPKYADEAEAMESMASGTVKLSPAKQQLIGVRTAPVVSETLTRSLRAVGIVEIDETRVAHVHTKVSGWVRRVFVDYTWQHVMQGEPLFALYSPELVSAQQEYLLARRAQTYLGAAPYREVAEGSNSLLRAARGRLKLWDVTDEQIAELEASGKPAEELTVFSPTNGHVSVRNVFPNQYVTPESDLYTIVDHSRVWVQAQLYEYEIEAVRVGQPVNMTVTALPGQVFRGRVIYVDPHLDMTTRSVNVRLEFSNPDFSLKPGMYATMEFKVPLGRQLVVPREALIDTGTRQLVFLAKPDGYFEPREIKVGERLEDRVVVLAGLRPGDIIVTSGAFLIDSESQLSAAIEGMGHQH